MIENSAGHSLSIAIRIIAGIATTNGERPFLEFLESSKTVPPSYPLAGTLAVST
jgi:hypothetical protein